MLVQSLVLFLQSARSFLYMLACFLNDVGCTIFHDINTFLHRIANIIKRGSNGTDSFLERRRAFLFRPALGRRRRWSGELVRYWPMRGRRGIRRIVENGFGFPSKSSPESLFRLLGSFGGGGGGVDRRRRSLINIIILGGRGRVSVISRGEGRLGVGGGCSDGFGGQRRRRR